MAKLEQTYDDILVRIWNGDNGDTEEDVVDEAEWNSPFMKAGRKQIQMVQQAGRNVSIPSPQLPGEAVIGALPDG